MVLPSAGSHSLVVMCATVREGVLYYLSRRRLNHRLIRYRSSASAGVGGYASVPIASISQTPTEWSEYWMQDCLWIQSLLWRSDPMTDDLDICEEKRRELAQRYADELLEAVDWLIDEVQTKMRGKTRRRHPRDLQIQPRRHRTHPR